MGTNGINGQTQDAGGSIPEGRSPENYWIVGWAPEPI